MFIYEFLFYLLCVTISSSNGFKITYPQEGDVVPVWRGAAGRGIPMTWSYNSTDDITVPLTISFIQAGPRGEEPGEELSNNVNITSKEYDIQATFIVAAYYRIRVIHGQDYYQSGRFDLSLSSQGQKTASMDSKETVTIFLSTSTTSTQIASSTSSGAENNPSSSFASNNTLPPLPIHDNKTQLGTGGKVGVGVGVAAAVIISLVIALFFLCRRRKRKQITSPERQTEGKSGPAELSAEGAQVQQRHELDGENKMRQLPIRETASEFPG